MQKYNLICKELYELNNTMKEILKELKAISGNDEEKSDDDKKKLYQYKVYHKGGISEEGEFMFTWEQKEQWVIDLFKQGSHFGYLVQIQEDGSGINMI